MHAHTISIPLAALESQARLRPDHTALWKRIVGSAESLSTHDTAHLLVIEANYYLNRGMYGFALKLARQAFALGRERDDASLMADALASSALGLNRLGSFTESQADAFESLALDSTGYSAVDVMSALGINRLYLNDFDGAQHWFERAQALSRRLNYDFGLMRTLHNLALVYRDRGEFELYLTTITEVNHFAGNFDAFRWSLPTARLQVAVLQGDRHEARRALRDYNQLGPQGERVDGVIAALCSLLYGDEEDFESAERFLQRALNSTDQTGDAYLTHIVRCAFSRLRRAQGDAVAAVNWAGLAITHALRLNSHIWECEARAELARARWALADMTAAEPELLTVLELSGRMGAQYWAALSAFLLAALYVQQGKPSADGTWREAERRIRHGGYGFIYEREREQAYPLLARLARSKEPATRSAAEQALEQLARIPPLPLRIKGLGKFEVLKGRLPIAERDWSRRRAGELFRFLLLQPQHAASREVIFEALCPEQTPAGAQTFLHHATSALRHSLEPDLPDKFPSRYVSVEFETVRLRLPSGSSVDFEEFEQRLAASHAPGSDAAQALQTALDGYAGDLFPGDRYADWSVAPRERLSELYRRALLELAAVRLAQGDAHATLDLCRTLLRGDPWNEGAVQLGMQACLALGRRPAALILYDNLERALRADLQIAPRKDLQQLAASIRTSN